MNVVLIVIDCLRLDYSLELWNILKKFNFQRLDSAITTAPWTIPAHASMLTGLYPSEHGAHETKTRKVGSIKFRIRDNLVNDLKRRGYTTYLITANAFLTERFGFRDFDYSYFVSNIPDKIVLKPDELKYLTEKTLDNNISRLIVDLIINREFKLLLKGSIVFGYRKISSFIGGWPKEKGISKIIRLIKKLNFEYPSFIFINLMELHEPYRTSNIKCEYKYQLEYLVNKFESLIEILNEKKLLDGIVIVTSDHGQLLGEKGRSGHGIYLDDELLKVPIFIKVPNSEKPNTKAGEQYVSHANLRKFITSFVDGNGTTDLLFSKAAFAESFGYYSNKVSDPQFEKHRIAIYCKGHKGVYDVENDKFEEISCKKLESELKSHVIEFLKKARVNRKKNKKEEIKKKIRKLQIHKKLQCNPD